VLLALSGTIMFAIQNFTTGDLSPLGAKGVLYFDSGILVFSALYFVWRACKKEEYLPD